MMATCWGPGGIEAIVTVKAIQDQFFPPTRNLDNPEPSAISDYVPHKGYGGRDPAAMSNALGFGGHDAIVVFREYKE